MKIQRIKTKIVAAVTAGVVMLSLVAAGAINVVRSTFAASENFELTKSGDVEIDGNVKQVSVYLKASKAGTLLSMNGDFLEKIEENSNLYFGLESITASDKVKDMVQDSTFADGIFVLSNGEAELAAGETILTATYRVMTATPAGRYQLSANIEAANVNGVGYEDESVSVEVVVSRGKNVPDVAFQESAISSVYGNTVNNTVVGTWGEGAPVYAVENTSVATIDSETGIVTGVGVGTTRVSATFAETETYEGVTIYYTLTVTPRAIAIMSANVQNKMYDGTTGATVSSVGFDDLVDGDLLELGTDYGYEANFDSANVGTGKQVNIVVSLRDTVKAKNYTLTDNTYKSYASIIPYVFSMTVDDLKMESYEFAYTGEPVKPTLTVTAKLSGGDKVLVEGQDYDAEYFAEMDEDEEPSTGDLEHDVTNVGDKLVVVTGKGNFEGVLSKTYAVVKANSGNPAEMTEGLKAAVGTKLGDIAGERTAGFNWADANVPVESGENTYPATYVKNNDPYNYNVSELSVPVYGLAVVEVVTESEAGGAVYSDKQTVLEGEKVTITLEPDEGWYVFEVFVNGVDRTAELDDNKLVLVAGKEDILVTATFIKPYEVIQGDEQTVTLGEDSNVVFKIDADYSLFNPGGAVFVDGEYVDEANYTSESGSTIISLNRDFVDTLDAGTHLLGVMFTDGGVAAAEFTIQASEEDGEVSSPDTGAFTAEKGMVAGAIALPSVLGIGAIVYMVSRRKKIDFTK